MNDNGKRWIRIRRRTKTTTKNGESIFTKKNGAQHKNQSLFVLTWHEWKEKKQKIIIIESKSGISRPQSSRWRRTSTNFGDFDVCTDFCHGTGISLCSEHTIGEHSLKPNEKSKWRNWHRCVFRRTNKCRSLDGTNFSFWFRPLFYEQTVTRSPTNEISTNCKSTLAPINVTKKKKETELMRPKTFHIDMNSSWFRWRVHWSCLARIEIPLQSTSEITHVDSIFYWMQKIWANLNGNWRRVECIHWRSAHWEDSHICFYFHTRFCCLKLKGCFHIGGVGFFPPSFLSLSPPKNRILRHDRRILFCFTGAG